MTESAPQEGPVGLLLSDDLIFTSRITGTGRDLGLRIQAARTPEQLLELAQVSPPRCVIVDLHNPGLQIADLVAQLRPAGRTGPVIVAYGSHVATAVLKAARAAGCDAVLPRSQFVEQLPDELPRWCGSAGSA
jgi:CheY-like chemotaxis protein